MRLAERFKAGELGAVEEMYRRYGQLVYSVALRLLRHSDLAQEATQEAFLRAWRAAGRLDADRELDPWLCTITRRVAIDIARREQRRAHLDLGVVDQERSLLVEPPDAVRLDAVWRTRQAVQCLPADERILVELHHLHDLTHQQIATRLGLPVGTVKSRLFRAHRRLAGRLAPLRREGEPAGATQDAAILEHGRRGALEEVPVEDSRPGGQPEPVGLVA